MPTSCAPRTFRCRNGWRNAATTSRRSSRAFWSEADAGSRLGVAVTARPEQQRQRQHEIDEAANDCACVLVADRIGRKPACDNVVDDHQRDPGRDDADWIPSDVA